MRQKHIPQRTCVVCKSKMDKRDLMRVVRTDKGVELDLTGRNEGRGAYLCHDKSCWESAMNSNVLSRALKMTVTNSDKKRLQQALTRS